MIENVCDRYSPVDEDLPVECDNCYKRYKDSGGNKRCRISDGCNKYSPKTIAGNACCLNCKEYDMSFGRCMRPIDLDYAASNKAIDEILNEDGTARVLNERGKTHGDFIKASYLHEKIMDVFKETEKFYYAGQLPSAMRNAAYMIIHKLMRAFMGDPMEKDHWIDIQGYAKLISDKLGETENG